MFSAVDVPRRGAKNAASSRSSAARSTSRPGDRRDQERHAGRDRQPPRAAGRDQRGLPQPDQAGLVRLHRGLLLQAAHRQGAAARSTAQGLIGLSSCLKGEVAEGIYTDQAREGARRGRGTYRDILGPDNFFLEMQDQGIDEQQIVNNGLLPASPASSACRWCAPTTCTTCAQDDHKPHDVLLCIGTGKIGQRRRAAAVPRRQFFLKTPEEMAEVFGDYPGRARQHGAHRRALQRQPRRERDTTCRTSTCRPATPSTRYFEHVVREGFAARLPRLQELMARGALRHTLDEYETRARRTRSR